MLGCDASRAMQAERFKPGRQIAHANSCMGDA
jgi:hypothetical protein